jgi:hypothetical protein
MIPIHGKTLVRTFRSAMLEQHGLQVLVLVGTNDGQLADDTATLASVRAGPVQDVGSDSALQLDGSMTVRDAIEEVRRIVGVSIRICDARGVSAPTTALVSECAAQSARDPETDTGSARGGIAVTGQKLLATLQREFSERFPQLGIMFFSIQEMEKAARGERIYPLPSDQTIARVRSKFASGDISIHGNTRVGTLEGAFLTDYGLRVQVCYMRDGKAVYTGDVIDVLTLTELNRRAEARGCGPFIYPTY